MKSYKKPKYSCGGKVKQYSVGGDIAKGVGAGLYGLTEGALDNITFGLTDGLTDKGYNALAKMGNKDAEDLKRSNIIRASGNIVGQVAGAIGTGGATTTNAISGGLKGVNNIMQNTGVNDKTKNLFNTGTQLAGLGLSFAGGGLNASAANAPQQLQNIMNTSKQLQTTSGLMSTVGGLKFQAGGNIPDKKSISKDAKEMFNEMNNQIIDTHKYPKTIPIGFTDPRTWGKKDYSNFEYFDAAYHRARQNGEKEFVMNGKRYNTKYKGTLEEQLKETGITDTQIQNRSNVNKKLYNNINPFSYDNMGERIWDAVINDEKDLRRKEGDNSKDRLIKNRLDALKLYSGLPQKNNTFSISKHKPSKGDDEKKEYYSINMSDFEKRVFVEKMFDEKGRKKLRSEDVDDFQRIMGNYTQYGSSDLDGDGSWISYYDKWDLSPMDFGKPFEIYDKIYYDYYPTNPQSDKINNTKRNLMNYSVNFLKNLDSENLPKDIDVKKLRDELRLRGFDSHDGDVNKALQNFKVFYNEHEYELMDAMFERAKKGLYYEGGFVEKNKQPLFDLQNKINSKYLTELNQFKNKQYYQSGGQVPNELMPYNPNQLDNVTQNTVQYNGGSHSQGGVPTPIGEFDKQEVVVKPQTVGNENAYALSDNLKISKESAEMFGLNKSFIGKTIAEVGKSIENKKPKREDKLHIETLELNKKKALETLMKVNEYEMSKNQSINGINSKEDMSFQQANAYQSGGQLPLLEADGTYAGRWQDQTLDYNQKGVPQYDLPQPDLTVPRQELSQYWNTNKINKDASNTSLPTVNNNSTNTPSGLFSSMTDLEKVGLGLKSAAQLGEIGMALKKPTKVATQYNPYKQQILQNADNRIDNQAQKNTAQLMMNSALNNNSRSTNVQRALNNQIFSNSLNQLGQLDLANQQMNNQYKQQLSQTYNQLGSQDVQARNFAEDLNARTTANYRNNLRQAIGNVGNQTADYLLKRDIAQRENAFNQTITTKMFDLYKEKSSSLGGASKRFDEMFEDVTSLSTEEKGLLKNVKTSEDLQKVAEKNPTLFGKLVESMKLKFGNE